jgi:hypothetical protein
MSYNTHFFVVKATDGEDAMDSVFNHTLDWANENNHVTSLHAISIDNETVGNPDEDESRVSNSIKEFPTIESINQFINKESTTFGEGKNVYDRLIKHEVTLDSLDWQDLYNLEQYIRKHRITYGHEKDFDILKGHNYFDGDYDELGVTNIESYGMEDDKLWVVVASVHS